MAGTITRGSRTLVGLALAVAATAFCPGRAAMAADAGQVLDEQARSGQASAARSLHHLDVGRKFYEEMKYSLARENLQLAVSLNPANKDARELLDRVNDVLGVRAASVRTGLERLAEERRVAVQEKLVELENAISKARASLQAATGTASLQGRSREQVLAEQAHNADRAVEAAERAREIIKWMPYDIDVADSRRDADTILSESIKVRNRIVSTLQQERVKAGGREIERTKLDAARQEEDKIAKLIDQVEMFFSQEDYVQAARLSREIIRIDPTNFRANELWVSARDRQHRKTEAELRSTRKHEKTTLELDMDAANIPYSTRIVYPDDWDRISMRQSQQATEAAEPEWRRELRRMLERPVTFEFVDTPLQEAIQFLQRLSQATIILDPRALEETAAASVPISFRVTDMPLSQALKWVLRLADLDYSLRDEAVFVSTPQRLAGDVTLRIYDVRDLTYSVTDFPGPELMISGADDQFGRSAGPISFIDTPSTDRQMVAAGDLADFIRGKVRPNDWAPELGTSIEERDGKLIVMQQPEVHLLVSQLLDTFRSTQTVQVMVQARFLEVRDGLLEDIGIQFADLPSSGLANAPADTRLSPAHPIVNDPNGVSRDTGLASSSGEYEYWVRSTGWLQRQQPFSSNLPQVSPPRDGTGALFQFRFLGNVAAQAVLHAVSKEEKGDLLLAPRLTMFNGQTSHIMVARQNPYIGDYDVSGMIYDPVISIIMTGTIMEVRPTVSHDKRYITLDVKPSTADSLWFEEDVLPLFFDPTGGGSLLQMPLHKPRIRIRTVRTTVTVPDGGTIMVSGLMSDINYEANAGVPFFSDLPVVGRLFGTDLKQRERVNLLLLVSANMVLLDEEESKL